jgi:hypothetical protein
VFSPEKSNDRTGRRKIRETVYPELKAKLEKITGMLIVKDLD